MIGADGPNGRWIEQLRKGRQLRAIGRSQGERRVLPRRQVEVDGGVPGPDAVAVAAVAEGRERRRGVR